MSTQPVLQKGFGLWSTTGTKITGISPDVLQRDTLLAAGIILQAVYRNTNSHISTQIRPPFSAPNCLTWGTGFFCTMRTGRSWKSSWEIIRSRSVHSRPPVICRAFCSPMDISNTQSYVKQQTGVGRLYSMPKFKHLS